MTTPHADSYAGRFDKLFTQGQEAILAGTHHRDTAPVDGGRWGLSVLLRPEGGTAEALAAITRDTMAVAGPDHWPTGCLDTAHVTVLPLEPFRSHVPPDDAALATYRAGMRKAAAGAAAVTLRFQGLTVTRHGVMACAYPVDRSADDLAERLKAAIGTNQWSQRDIWYATVVHFAGTIATPETLIDWVAARRSVPLGQARFNELTLAGWRYDGRQARPVPYESAPLSAAMSPTG